MTVLENEKQMELLAINEAALSTDEELLASNTFINCDLRLFDLCYLVEELGDFGVVLVDPPWINKGSQINSTNTEFPNNTFDL